VASAAQQQCQDDPNQDGPELLRRAVAWLRSSRVDLERALSRIAAGTAAPSELVTLLQALLEVGGAALLRCALLCSAVHCVTCYMLQKCVPPACSTHQPINTVEVAATNHTYMLYITHCNAHRQKL
jgi:hypothetical protein